VIVLYIPPLESAAPDVASGIVRAADELDGAVPILTTFMSARGLPEELRGGRGRLPSYTFPEQAAIALARASAYGTWHARDHGRIPVFVDLRTDEAAGIVATALERGDGWLDPEEVDRLLACYGVPTAATVRATTPEAAAAAASTLGGVVALKAFGPELVHKTEIGAVALHVPIPEVVGRARAMKEAIEAGRLELTGFVVQRMVADGVEMFVGMEHDPVFGPVLAVGAGGTAVELTKDIAVRITPITDLDAGEMLRELETFPLLDGYRGAPRTDVHAIEQMLLRVGALVEDHPGISELDLNPVMALTDGAVVVDARVLVASEDAEGSSET
jgi:acyl-CoA synthetase (NDP forming)